MYLGSWKIDDLVTFTVNTHNPSTGAAADADAVPAYRVYEDETGTAILSGNMAKLDDANTLGFYSEQITLSAANGFEKGKSYNIYISAAVGGVTGTTARNLQIEAEVDANVVSDKTGYGLSAAAVQAIWDALTSALTTAGSIGKLLVDNINATVGSRASQTSVDTVDDFLDTEIAAIKAKTDNLPGDPADASDIAAAFATVNSTLATIAGYLDTEIAAIKAKTDQLTFTAANKVDAAIQAAGDFVQAAADKVWSSAARTLTSAANITSTGGTTVPQTGDSFARIGSAGAGLTDLGGMSTTMKGQVNAEVLDVLNTDTFAEPGQEAPPATTTLAKKIGYLYKLLRNKLTQTSTELKVYADDGTTVDQKATVSDDGSTYTRGEIGSGP
jgi:hypothetical protein